MSPTAQVIRHGHGSGRHVDRDGTTLTTVAPGSSPTRRVGAAFVTVSAGRQIDPRADDRAEQLLYVIAGHGHLLLGDRRPAAIGPGHAFAAHAGVSHAVRASAEADLRVLRITAPSGEAAVPRGEAAAGTAAGADAAALVLASEQPAEYCPGYGHVTTLAANVTRRFMFMFVDAAPDEVSPRHLHRVLDEMFIVLSGTAVVSAGQVLHVVGAGDTVVVPANTAHNLRAGPDGVRYVGLHAGDDPSDPDFHPVADGFTA
jgi:mannose-6-phosphate isomerase-like protein (cupin superfamily)